MTKELQVFSDAQISAIELQGEDVAQKMLHLYNLLLENQKKMDILIIEEARVSGELRLCKSRKSHLSHLLSILKGELHYLDPR